LAAAFPPLPPPHRRSAISSTLPSCPIIDPALRNASLTCSSLLLRSFLLFIALCRSFGAGIMATALVAFEFVRRWFPIWFTNFGKGLGFIFLGILSTPPWWLRWAFPFPVAVSVILVVLGVSLLAAATIAHFLPKTKPFVPDAWPLVSGEGGPWFESLRPSKMRTGSVTALTAGGAAVAAPSAAAGPPGSDRAAAPPLPARTAPAERSSMSLLGSFRTVREGRVISEGKPNGASASGSGGGGADAGQVDLESATHAVAIGTRTAPARSNNGQLPTWLQEPSPPMRLTLRTQPAQPAAPPAAPAAAALSPPPFTGFAGPANQPRSSARAGSSVSVSAGPASNAGTASGAQLSEVRLH
jgi:hypothetical protein